MRIALVTKPDRQMTGLRRYAESLYQGVAIRPKQYLLLPLYTFVDFIAWSLPLLHLLTRRHQW